MSSPRSCEVCGRIIDDLGCTPRQCDNCQRYCCLDCKPDFRTRCVQCPTLHTHGFPASVDSGNLEECPRYEIILKPGIECPDVELVHDDPESVLAVRDSLYSRGHVSSHITRDGVIITDVELERDVASYRIRVNRQSESKLLANFRSGRTSLSDHAESSSGERVPVWRPTNPDDRFD